MCPTYAWVDSRAANNDPHPRAPGALALSLTGRGIWKKREREKILSLSLKEISAHSGKVCLVDKPSTPREHARQLRREQTEAELFLWARLRARQLSGAKFRRQWPIGPFIVDFCCVEHRLIIELDGGQHASEVEKDEARSECLRKEGYEVLRFWNHEVFLESWCCKGLRICRRRAGLNKA